MSSWTIATLADRLASHVEHLGFTHVELMPITEHPFDGSWGYQALGYFAPTSRFGTPDDFRQFVDHLHQRGVGVLLDWVPAHFPRDAHGLARFDGTALYEHADPRLGEHRDWDTLIFNYGRNEVRNFLTSSALFWLNEFHIDGLRVDAVASMLYLDYSRRPGDWLPNRLGGRENLEAIEWIKELNEVTHGESPGTMIIAEESTSWPQVTRPTYAGGLGFTLKWNMGWMNDTLAYIHLDPVHRKYHHRHLTFGMLYAFSEHFLLPLSHDEVVHGKSSLLGKMPGDDWQRFANLRLLFTYQFLMPGKKLLFMGGEFGQRAEWNHDRSLDWHLLDYAPHRGVFDLVGALNRLYRSEQALNLDSEPAGFQWIDCDDMSHSVISFERRSGADLLIVVLNFTPVPRHNYRVGTMHAGAYREIFNSDSSYYGGSNLGNAGRCETQNARSMGYAQSLSLTLPPLAGIVLKRDRHVTRDARILSASCGVTCERPKRQLQFPSVSPGVFIRWLPSSERKSCSGTTARFATDLSTRSISAQGIPRRHPSRDPPLLASPRRDSNTNRASCRCRECRCTQPCWRRSCAADADCPGRR